MRYLIPLLLLFSLLRTFGAVGDTTGLEISTNGARARGWVSGLNIQGRVFNGFATNNSITGAQKMTLTITSPGWSSSGVSQSVSRVAYLTWQERLMWPLNGTNNIVAEGDGCIPSFWLSKYIYAGDTVVASGADGWYAVTNGTGTNALAFTSQVATNLSTQPHQVVIGNWMPTTPRFDRISNSVTVRAVGFHNSGRDGKPIALCRFIATGQTSGNKVTNDVTRMATDTAWWSSQAPYWNKYTNAGNINPAHYYTTMDMSGMSNNEIVRFDVKMLSHVGDTNAVLDTTRDTYLSGSPLPTHLLNRYDPTNSHSTTIAVVDNVNGNDTNGRCSVNPDPTSIATSNYYASAGAALNASAATNNTFFGHNDTSGVIIYLKSTCTNFPGVNITSTGLPSVKPRIVVYPGDAPPTLTHRVAAVQASNLKRIRFEGINCAWAASQIPLWTYELVEFVGGTNTSISTQPIQLCTNTVFAFSSIGSFAQGLRGIGAETMDVSVIGCDLGGFSQPSVFRTWIGNVHPETNLASYTINSALGTSQPHRGYEICYNNYFGGGRAAPLLNLANNSSVNIGQAIVQNVFEECLAGERVGAIAGTNATNVILWHNLLEGGRIADYGSGNTEEGVVWRTHFSTIGNIWAVPGQKDEITGTPSTNRYGSWDLFNMVDAQGNFYIRNNVTGPAASFRADFAGMFTYEPGHTNVDNFANFIDRKAALASTSTAGHGNYRLFKANPVETTTAGFNSPLSHDILGNEYSQRDTPGPYEFTPWKIVTRGKSIVRGKAVLR